MEDRLRDFGEMYKGMSKEEINEEFLNDAISGIFSTDEGVEDFLRWLQSDSGYSEENKKSIIQRICEWLNDILDMIRDIISGGTLSDTAQDYMKMQEDEAKRIRKMFLSVLDEVAKGVESGAYNADAERYSFASKKPNKSLTKGKGKRYNKSTYDEFTSLGMQWAYSAGTKFGDTKYAYNPRNKTYCFIEATKTDVGFIVLEEYTSEQWRENYGRLRKDEGSLREYIGVFDSGRRSGSGGYSSRYTGEDGRNVRFSSTEGFQGSEAGNPERNGQNNQEIQDDTDSRHSLKRSLGISEGEEPRYSFKSKKHSESIAVSRQEYTMLSSAVMAYNTRFGKKDELKPIISVNSNDYFYVCENHDSGDFSILARLNPESQTETIKQIREVIKDETFSISEFTSLYAQNDVSKWRDRRRRNNMHLFDAENRRTGQGSGGLYVDQPEHNELSSAGKSDGDTSDEYRHSLKRSLGISEGERKSLVSQITELERINDDLRLQLRHPGQKHILSMTAVQSVARQIKKDYKSTVGVHELSDALFELYSLIANEEAVAWDVVDTHLTAIGEMVLKKSKYYQPDVSEENKAILRDIRSVKIKFSDKQKTAVSEVYGSYKCVKIYTQNSKTSIAFLC